MISRTDALSGALISYGPSSFDIPVLDQCGALGFGGCSMLSYGRALHVLCSGLDPCFGIGHAAVGMHRQDFDLQLTQYDARGWSTQLGDKS